MCIITAESSQSDSCQPSVLSGDSRHCSDVESEVSDASSDSIPEECSSPATSPFPSEGSSASLLDVGVLIKSGTLRSLDKSMKLKLVKQAQVLSLTIQRSLCMVATDGLNLSGPKAIHGYITVYLRMVSIAKLASCLLLLMLSNRN